MRILARRKLTRAKLRARKLVFAGEREQAAVRRRLARRYLSGDGLEIGALHMPLALPRGARARYVDRMGLAELRAHYPELDRYDVVAPDVVDDGETLASVPDGSVDFVIANHLIEHCQDPIGTLLAHARVLTENGALYLAVPDRRKTFDRDRPETTLAHLVRDHEQGPEWSRAGHYDEWTRLAMKVPAVEAEEHAAMLDAQDYSIHFHTFTPSSFLALLLHCREAYDLPLEPVAAETNGHEFVVVARRGRTLRATSTTSAQARGPTTLSVAR